MGAFYAKRANKVLRINEESIDKYLGQGYTITDMQGKVVRKGTPKDTVQLTAEYTKQAEEIKSLKDEIARLLAENSQLKAELSKPKKAEKAEETVEETKPTRKRKSSSTEDKE